MVTSLTFESERPVLSLWCSVSEWCYESALRYM